MHTKHGGMEHEIPNARELKEMYARRDAALARIQEQGNPEAEGAGIVMVAGGLRHFASAYVTICWLQDKLQTHLPIQVWHLGDDELNKTMKNLLLSRDVQLVNAHDVRGQYPVRILGGWECKPYALIHCGFRHAILLDADAIPLSDPSDWLDFPEYRESGAVFWPDNQSHLSDSPVWQVFDVPYRDELEVESGQLLVDTDRCWAALNLAMHYCEWSDIYFQYVYGDKETFHFAWRFLDQEYASPSGRPNLVHCERDTPLGRRRMTLALEQKGFDGKPVVQHRTGGKWAPYGENPPGNRRDIDSFAAIALANLRDRWDGRMSDAPHPSIDHDLHPPISPVRVRLTELGQAEHLITLCSDGTASGDDVEINSWHLDNDKTLTLSEAGAETHRLRRNGGRWLGDKLVWDKSQTVLELLP